MQLAPEQLAPRLDVLAENVVAIEVHLAQLTAVVADTKRQIEEMCPSPFPARTLGEPAEP
jgi:hypothetical protein